MRPPARLHHIGLGGKSGQSGRGPAALHVDKHAGRLGHGGIANVFHHQRESWAGGYGERLGSAPYSTLQRDRGREFVFHLNECSPYRRHACREALDYLGRWGDRISGRESCSGRQCAFTAGMVAIEKMCAGQNTVWICFHFSPPPACLALSCGILVPLIAKSGQYIPHKSQPLHFSGCTTCGGW